MCRHRLDSTSQSDSKITTNVNNKASRLFRKFIHNLGFILILLFRLHLHKMVHLIQSIFVCKKCKTKAHFILKYLQYLFGTLSHLDTFFLGDLYYYTPTSTYISQEQEIEIFAINFYENRRENRANRKYIKVYRFFNRFLAIDL